VILDQVENPVLQGIRETKFFHHPFGPLTRERFMVIEVNLSIVIFRKGVLLSDIMKEGGIEEG
jgi:hypothetical protein